MIVNRATANLESSGLALWSLHMNSSGIGGWHPPDQADALPLDASLTTMEYVAADYNSQVDSE